MSNLREAAQQALEALDIACRKYGDVGSADTDWGRWDGAMTAIRAALEQEQAETAWVCPESPEHRYAKPGHCEDCGKTLVLEQKAEPVAEDAKQQALDALNRMQSILMMSGGRHPRDVLRTYIQLTAAQPQRKPLTDEEIVEAVREADLDWQAGWTLDEHEPNRFTTLARAIERAHGIEEEE